MYREGGVVIARRIVCAIPCDRLGFGLTASTSTAIVPFDGRKVASRWGAILIEPGSVFKVTSLSEFGVFTSREESSDIKGFGPTCYGQALSFGGGALL